MVCLRSRHGQKKRAEEREVIAEALEELAKAITKDGDERKTPQQIKREAERAAHEQLHDPANLDRYITWILSGGNEQGLNWREIAEMDPEEMRDFQMLGRIFSPLLQKYRKQAEERRKKKVVKK